MFEGFLRQLHPQSAAAHTPSDAVVGVGA